MELNFYDVRIGTRTKAGNLNVIHSFICKSFEVNEYKIRNFYESRYSGFSIDVLKVVEVVEAPKEILQNNDPFESEKSESCKKIKELEQKIKKLQESKNSVFVMTINSHDLNSENKIIYNRLKNNYKIYYDSVVELENAIKKQIEQKYDPFVKNIYTDERINGHNNTMKFRLELINKLF